MEANEEIGAVEVFCLPVPDKAQRQQNFVIFTNTAVAWKGFPDNIYDQFVWTMNETQPKDPKDLQVGAEYSSSHLSPGNEDTYVTITTRCLNTVLKSIGKKVIVPDENQFASAIPQSHRKGEKAYHVKAHIGSKEGERSRQIRPSPHH